MTLVSSASNRALHVAMACVVAVEAGGIAWELARTGQAARIAIAAVAALAALAFAWWISWEPEREVGTEVAEAVVDQDMRGIPRWWGSVPLAVAALGALWAWLALST